MDMDKFYRATSRKRAKQAARSRVNTPKLGNGKVHRKRIVPGRKMTSQEYEEAFGRPMPEYLK